MEACQWIDQLSTTAMHVLPVIWSKLDAGRISISQIAEGVAGTWARDGGVNAVDEVLKVCIQLLLTHMGVSSRISLVPHQVRVPHEHAFGACCSQHAGSPLATLYTEEEVLLAWRTDPQTYFFVPLQMLFKVCPVLKHHVLEQILPCVALIHERVPSFYGSAVLQDAACRHTVA